MLVLGSAFNANVMYGGAPLFGAEQTIASGRHRSRADRRQPGRGRRRSIGDIASVVRDVCRCLGRHAARTRRVADPSAKALAAASLGFWNRQVDEHDGRRLHAGAVAREVAAFVRERFGGNATLRRRRRRRARLGAGLLRCGAARPPAHHHHRARERSVSACRSRSPRRRRARMSAVFLFTGDGSFGLSAMEVDTAVRHKLPVIVVVSNNAGWGDVRYEQDELFGPGRHVASTLPGVRYDRLARGARRPRRARRDASRSSVRRSSDRSPAASAASSTSRPTRRSSPSCSAWSLSSG